MSPRRALPRLCSVAARSARSPRGLRIESPLRSDGIDFGVETLRRVRSVLTRERGDRGLLDLHSGNNNDAKDRGRYGNVSAALQYMGVFPHIDSLWFGEGYHYGHEDEDYWLVEVSGLAFGITGDLMCNGEYGGGVPWRGLLYGLRVRQCTFQKKDAQNTQHTPPAIWRLFNLTRVSEARMYGFWRKARPPVQLAGCPNVRLTSYVRKGQLTLLALAGWEGVASGGGVTGGESISPARNVWDQRGQPYERVGGLRVVRSASDTDGARVRLQQCELIVDWQTLGLALDQSELYAPALSTWQDFKQYELRNEKQPGRIPVAFQHGLVLVLARRSPSLASLRATLQQKTHDVGQVQYRQEANLNHGRATLIKLLQAMKRGEKCTRDRSTLRDADGDEGSSDSITCS